MSSRGWTGGRRARNECRGKRSSLLRQQLPTNEHSEDHPEPDLEAAEIVNVAALAQSHAGKEGDGTFDQVDPELQSRIEEVSIELQVHVPVQVRHQAVKRARAAEIVSGSHDGK